MFRDILEYITEYLISRKESKQIDAHRITFKQEMTHEDEMFLRVCNTVNMRKIMIWKKDDGIYIRLAGRVDDGEFYTKEWVCVKSFSE